MTLFNSGFLLKPLLAATISIACIGTAVADASPTQPLKALAIHGTAKYASQDQPFTHFDYVNPDAPKKGTVRMAASGTYDSLNPYIARGTPATGTGLIYDTLMTQSRDEPFSLYPLVAESAEPSDDNSQITFNLNPKARFHDGKAITAEDVKFTFEALITKGHPHYRSYYGDVERVDVLSPQRVRFVFKHSENAELPFILAELPVLPAHYWQKPENNFEATILNAPLGSGPYRISQVDPGRSITYSRVDDYWARDLPVNRGRYNFNTVHYDYYRDENISLQALTAGKYDLRFEYVARNWATAYDVPAVHRGDLKLETIVTRNPAPIQGFVFNTRRNMFADAQVREALTYAMDFEWLNRNLFYDSYNRSKSYFGNSGMEATGVPMDSELKLLEPWRDQLPAELFTKLFTVPETDGSGNIRPQLREALPLLEQAGWSLTQGKLVNDKGEQMKIELLLAQPSFERVALPFKKNLEAMGIDMSIRTVDISQYINRIRSFDYDMIVSGYGQSASPGNEQREYWGSHAATTQGSRNYAGINNPVVDAMIDHVVDARSREELTVAVRALDRVLLWGHYLIPQWYSPYDKVAYNSKLQHPQSEPLYSTDIFTWWVDDKPQAAPASTESTSTEEQPSSPSNPGLYGGIALVLLLLLGLSRRRKQA